MATPTISTAFVKQYGSTLQMLLELRGGQFDGKCITETINGEEKYFDQLGSVFATERIERFGDSPENDITHDRRRLVATAYHVGLPFDSMDKVQMLINPESGYIQRMVTALGRKKTIEFLKGALGTAYSGKAGATSNIIGSGQYVAVATGSTGSTGFNLTKIQAAREILETNNIDMDDPMNMAYIAWGPKQKRELLASEKATSSDFTNIQALVNGKIGQFYGFTFVDSNMLPYINTAGTGINLDWSAADTPVDTDSTDIRACFAWVKSGICQATNPDVTTRIADRADKSFNWYGYACLRTGTTRFEEEKVVVIPSDQSPA